MGKHLTSPAPVLEICWLLCPHPAPSPSVLSGESVLSNSVFCLFSGKMAEMRFSYKCALCSSRRKSTQKEIHLMRNI